MLSAPLIAFTVGIGGDRRISPSIVEEEKMQRILSSDNGMSNRLDKEEDQENVDSEQFNGEIIASQRYQSRESKLKKSKDFNV